MTERFTNNASSTLNGAINDSTTTIVVTSATTFPTQGNFRLLIGVNPLTAELVLVTNVSGNTFTVIRGQEGTTAISWADLTTVTHILTAGAVEALRANLRRDKPLDSSLDSVGAAQDGYALTWLNADGYWAARPGSPFSISGNELNTTKTIAIDEVGTYASAHGDGYSKLYVNGNILATKLSAGEIPLTTQNFSYVSDNLQTFTVPAGVTLLKVKMWGPGGGTGNYAGAGGGGAGGYSTGFLTVTPGETLYLAVGSGGKHPVSTTGNGGAGGWPGGGFGSRGDASGAGGGGLSGIFNVSMTQANALMIAAGGGGSTGFGGFGAGGGGGLTGGSGSGTSGKGATQSAGGLDGNGLDGTTTIAAGSNGATLPTGTINVASTTTFPTSGVLLVTTSAGIQIVGFTGKNATQFTGCTGGTGTMSTGGSVISAIAGSALRGGIPYQDQTTSQSNDSGGGGSGYYGGGAGQSDGRAGGGGSGFIHATRVLSGSTTTGSNAIGGTSATPPPNTTDVNYSAGVGVGAAATGAAGTDGGNGYIVLQWGGITTLDLDSIDFGNTASISTVDTNITMSSATNGNITLSAAGTGTLTMAPGSGLITLSSASDISFTSGTSSILFNMNSAQKFKVYSSGAVVIGGADTQNDTSAEAQANLTGPLINLSSSSGSFTSAANQAIIYNQSGALNLQGNTEIRFNTGSNFRGYFDSNGVFRIGPSASSAATLQGASTPFANSDYLYMYNSSGSSWAEIIAGATNARAALQVMNSGAGGTSTVGVSLFAGGTAHATTEYAGNGIIEQVGASTSGLIFTKVQGNATNFASTGAIWQTGAWTIGRATHNDTSSEAQAGLTGPLINISQATGSFTSTTNQALNFNIGGSHHIQGHADVRFDVGTNLAGYFDSNRIFRIGTDATLAASGLGTVNLWPINNDTAIFASTSNNNISSLLLSANETKGEYFIAGGQFGSNGIRLIAGGSAHSNTAWRQRGIIEQVGPSTSNIVFSKLEMDNTNRAITGRIYQSGAWTIGDATQNDTSSEAQAGLTGPLLNLSQITGGSLTSTTNQSLLYNNAGTTTLQGHVGHSFISNTTTIASTSTSKFITNAGRRVATNVRTGNYTVLTTDEIIIVGTLSSAITITLPAGPSSGDTYVIKDQAGGSATNNIIVSGNGNNIDGAATYTINTNYQSITVVFANGTWSII